MNNKTNINLGNRGKSNYSGLGGNQYPVRLGRASLPAISRRPPGYSPTRQNDAAILKELDRVFLLGTFSSEDNIIPSGSKGTIVFKWTADLFEVEFTEPVSAVVTLRSEEIGAADD